MHVIHLAALMMTQLQTLMVIPVLGGMMLILKLVEEVTPEPSSLPMPAALVAAPKMGRLII